MFRIGNGYDVHKMVEGRKLILCGVDVPYEKGLLGHSDADVATHAIMDALLGALALGDIGKHFPDTDDRYKDADSLKLLSHVMKLIDERGYKVVNIDCIIVMQKPKIKDYIDEMRKNLSDTMCMPTEDISVKATTEEKLGFTGDGTGVKSYAVALLEKK